MSDSTTISTLGPLAELLTEISKEPPLQQLLDHILDAACRLTHADTGTVGLYDPTTDAMRVAALHDPHQPFFPTSYARGEGLGGQILATGSGFHGLYRDLPKPRIEHLMDHEVHGQPIRWQERLLGYFAVSLAPPRRFQQFDIELLELLARVAAIAVEHARRQEEERRSSLRFELIASIASDIQREVSCDTLLQRTADAIHELLQFPNVDIPLIDPADPGTLVLSVRGGDYKRRIRHVDRLLVNHGIMGAAVRERRTQLCNDVRNDPRYICPPGVTPAQAELAVPIRSADRVLGVLNVESDRAFDDLDRRSLELIADYLAVAIDKALLFEQAGHVAVLAERQRLARELHDNVTQILSSISLLSQTLAAAWQRSPEDGERRVARLQQLAKTAFAEMRMLLRELSPPELMSAPTISRQSRSLVGLEVLRTQALPAALTRLLAAILPEGMAVKSSFSTYVPQRLEHEEALYRVCQEAVSNTMRHAGAKRLRVEAAVTASHAVLRVVDDGSGLSAEFRPGVGLGSMRTRIEDLRGQFRIAPNTPQGTLIEARLPRIDRDAANT